MADTSQLPIAVKSGTITIMGISLECHILSDGTRVIAEESMTNFMTALENGEISPDVPSGAEDFARFMNQGILPDADN